MKTNAKTILYIHGYKGSANGQTSQNLQSLFGTGVKVIAPGFNVENPKLAKQQVEAAVQDVDMVIASSMGGFYALNCVKNKPCIVLNPCIRPQEVFERFWDENDEKPDAAVLEEWNKLDMTQNSNTIPDSEKALKYGVFASDDELFHFKDLFDTTFGQNQNSILVGGMHQIGKDIPNLSHGLEAALSFFNKI